MSMTNWPRWFMWMFKEAYEPPITRSHKEPLPKFTLGVLPHGFSKFNGWKRYAFHAILWLEYIIKFWEENYKFLDIWLASPFHHLYGACIWWILYWDLFLVELVTLIWHIYSIIYFFIITLMSYGAFNVVKGLERYINFKSSPMGN